MSDKDTPFFYRCPTFINIPKRHPPRSNKKKIGPRRSEAFPGAAPEPAQLPPAGLGLRGLRPGLKTGSTGSLRGLLRGFPWARRVLRRVSGSIWLLYGFERGSIWLLYGFYAGSKRVLRVVQNQPQAQEESLFLSGQIGIQVAAFCLLQRLPISVPQKV